MSTRGRVGLLVNPTAGRGAGASAGARASEALRRLGHEVLDLSGRDLETTRRVAAEQAPDLDALVVVGGDGLVHAGVEAVAGTGTPLGIVAAGTGNDVARGLGLPLGDPVAAVRLVSAALHEGRTRAVDAVRVSGPERSGWCASIVASGVDALINERANAWRWPRGPLRYTLAAVRELAVVRGIALRTTLDAGTPGQRVLEGETLLVAVANTRCYGGGLTIAPDADPTDGLLDVVVVDRLSPVHALRFFPRVRSGTHLAIEAVTVHRAASVLLEPLGAPPWPRPHADGEPAGALPVRCEVVPGALRVLV